MIKFKLSDFLSYVAVFLVVLVLIGKVYIVELFGRNTICSYILLLSSFIIFILMIKKKTINRKRLVFPILLIMMWLPSLYNNAYIADGKLEFFLNYTFAILFFCLYSLYEDKNEKMDFVLKIFVAFALIASIATWISYLFPKIYLEKMIYIIPEYSRELVVHMFKYDHAYAGITNHYSRNAFYILLGVLASIKFLNKNRGVNIALIIFFLITLFLVGKRGHLLFLGMALIISYFITNRVSIKVVLRFIMITIILSLIVTLAIRYIPGADNIFNRITNYSKDVSTGRFALYDKAIDLYKSNENTPIGWGQFSKSTKYYYAAVHNDYLQIFVETGIIGLLLIIGGNLIILFKSIFLVRKEKSLLAYIILSFNIFFLLYSLTGLPHYDSEVYLAYFIFNTFLFINLTNNTNLKKEIEEN